MDITFLDFGHSVDINTVDKDIIKRSYLTIDYFFKELEHLNIDYENILFILDGDRLRIYDGGNYQKSYHSHMSKYFVEKSKDNNIKFINLQSVMKSDFSKNKKEFNFPFDYHWNEYGNKVAAHIVEEELTGVLYTPKRPASRSSRDLQAIYLHQVICFASPI